MGMNHPEPIYPLGSLAIPSNNRYAAPVLQEYKSDGSERVE